MAWADRDATRKALSKPAAFVLLTKGLALKTELTAARLRELLHYDPETGVFTRRVATGGRWPIGSVTGSLSEGYWLIRVNGARYRANRLAWLYMTGRWPKAEVDHKNGAKSDNAFGNLRDVTGAINTQNLRRARRDNQSCSILGVTWDARRQKWLAQIRVGASKRFLGRFTTTAEASAAYVAAKRVHHAGCTL